MVAKKCVSVDIVKVTLVGVRKSLLEPVNFFRAIKAQEVIQPLLNWIAVSIPDWLVKRDFFQEPALGRLVCLLVIPRPLLSFQLVNQLERQTSTCAFVAVHS